jgi:hypothetical protein
MNTITGAWKMDGTATACSRRKPFDVELVEANERYVAVRQQHGQLVWLERSAIWQDNGRSAQLLGDKVRLYLRDRDVQGSGLIPVAHTKIEAERIALGLPTYQPILPTSQRIEGMRHTTEADEGELDAMCSVTCHVTKVWGKCALITKRYELHGAPAYYKERWVPLSQVFARRIEGKDCEVFMPCWLARQHGFMDELAA